MAFECPKCGAEFHERLKYCPECGFDFTAGQKKCPRCKERVDIDAEICPECGLDFERYAFFMPRIIVFGTAGVVIILMLIWPWVWRSTPWLHDKGFISEGQLRSEVGGQTMAPLFINWKTGERFIEKSAEASGYSYTTDYMNNLVPLPPAVIFHYDVPIGEKVWIIRRANGITSDWVQVGRWVDGHDKYGWVHSTNIIAEQGS